MTDDALRGIDGHIDEEEKYTCMSRTRTSRREKKGGKGNSFVLQVRADSSYPPSKGCGCRCMMTGKEVKCSYRREARRREVYQEMIVMTSPLLLTFDVAPDNDGIVNP